MKWRINANVEHILEVWDRMPREHVSVNSNKLKADSYTAVAVEQKFELPTWQVRGVYPESPMSFPSHIFWLNDINYAYNHPVKLTTGGLLKFQVSDCFGRRQSGAYALSACLYRAFGDQPILAKDLLPHLRSLSAFKRFFAGFNSMPLISERREMLAEAVLRLEQFFGGNPVNIFSEAQYNAHAIIEILEDLLPLSFTDTGSLLPYAAELNFQKRANLMVVMYHDRAVASGGVLAPIKDIATVGPIPDYELPRSYEADGIFSYGAGLSQKINNAEPIEPGSKMELEIRLATVWAQYYELKWLNRARAVTGLPPLHIGHVDYYRWSRGKKAKGRLPHICLTTK